MVYFMTTTMMQAAHSRIAYLTPVALGATLLFLSACAAATAPGGTEQGFVQNDNIRLQWFLDLPEGQGPFPAVVYGPGSGSVSAGHQSTIDFARELNRLGFAVMRYDKRGTGESNGTVVAVSTANSSTTIPLLASDMQAVMNQLLNHARIDPQRIGLFGSSQAQWYMPLVAEATPEVRFMVVITGGVAPVGFQNRYEEMTRLEGKSPAEAEAALGLLSDFTGPLGFDPLPILSSVNIPLLYLFGGADVAGPLQANLVVIDELAAGGVDVEQKVYPGAGHLLPGVDFWPDVADWLERIRFEQDLASGN